MNGIFNYVCMCDCVLYFWLIDCLFVYHDHNPQAKILTMAMRL